MLLLFVKLTNNFSDDDDDDSKSGSSEKVSIFLLHSQKKANTDDLVALFEMEYSARTTLQEKKPAGAGAKKDVEITANTGAPND